MPSPSLAELVDHIAASTGVPAADASRLLDEILEALAEPAPAFVRRRHNELHARGLNNDEIWPRLVDEVAGRRFPLTLSERQIRRHVYG